jgi:uncharacterized protein
MGNRSDRRTRLEELDRDECVRLLARSSLGRLGVVVDGRPFVFPVNFTLDGAAVVFRSDEGTKVHAARKGPVAFECDGIDATYHGGWSVLLLGEAEQVRNPVEVARLERLPLSPWCPGPKPIWLRLRASSITGRCIPPPGDTLSEEELRCP